ncbi:hypothetical protein IHE45_09G056000 [Dioscorea alata]|uniref:Uncharacterized protein n=1 Tax=Dioscorea alata TaxID=55571 RepID=A0ACB7VF22_DIOAL|nr:hypothetical protein IHE45_09G056000 [Dioscorea alata]
MKHFSTCKVLCHFVSFQTLLVQTKVLLMSTSRLDKMKKYKTLSALSNVFLWLESKCYTRVNIPLELDRGKHAMYVHKFERKEFNLNAYFYIYVCVCVCVCVCVGKWGVLGVRKTRTPTFLVFS